MIAPSTSTPSLDFRPDEAAADALLIDLASPDHSLASVARKHNLPVAALALWLTTPAARERMLTIERGAYTHVRMSAALNLNTAVQTFVTILNTFQHAPAPSLATGPLPTPDSSPGAVSSPTAASPHIAPPASPPSAAPSAFATSAFATLRLALRQQSLALRAAYHLCRLARIVPVSDDDLARARTIIPPRQSAAASPRHTPTEPSRLNPRGPVPSSPTPPHAHTPAPAPAPSPSHAPTLTATPAPAPPAAPPVALMTHATEAIAARDAAPNAAPNAASPSAPASLEELTAELEALAHSLGVDISDIDDDAPLPPEALAFLPPDIVNFLATDALDASPLDPSPLDPSPLAPHPLAASP